MTSQSVPSDFRTMRRGGSSKARWKRAGGIKMPFAALLSAFVCGAAYSQIDPGLLYPRISSATVLLRHEIMMDPALCRNAALFKKWEAASDRQLLSTYFLLSSGSGFFVGSEGLVMTNRHVAVIEKLDEYRSKVANEYSQDLEKNIPKDFTKEDIRSLKSDVYAMITKGAYRFSATLDGELLPQAETVAVSSEKDLDIAVLRVPGGFDGGLGFIEASLADSRLVGRIVYSLGFPLGGSIGKELKEVVVTMNKGTVSAVRKVDLGIQHSAAISPGNSGGPLVDESGLVVGMNTATVEGGNSIFLAIGADRIRAFLQKQGLRVQEASPIGPASASPAQARSDWGQIAAPVAQTADSTDARDRSAGVLAIRAPNSVQVTIRGADYSATVLGDASIPGIAPGEYSLAAEGAEYLSFSASFRLEAGQKAEWCPYEKGAVMLAIAPRAARCALVSGLSIAANAPQLLDPGTYSGVVSCPGYRDQAVSFPIAAGKPTSVSVRLVELARGSIVLPRLAGPVVVDVQDVARIKGKENPDHGNVIYEGVPTGLPLTVSFVCPTSSSPHILTRQVELREGEALSLDLPSGRFSLPWIPEGAVVEIGKDAKIALKNEGTEGFLSPALAAGTYEVEVRGGSKPVTCSFSAGIAPEATVEPDAFRGEMSKKLGELRDADARAYSRKRNKTKAGIAVLSTGIAGAVGAGTFFILGNSAMDAYMAAPDSAAAAARWKDIELDQALFYGSAGIAALGFAVSPFLFLGGRGSKALKDSVDSLDAQIALLRKE
jgi:S1-C subfamily serine protease